eukprot:3602254-Alexandrium_andersonii.AAC.1
MQGAADMNEVKATVFTTVVFKVSDQLYVNVKDMTKQYREKVSGNKGHSLGPPDVWAWRGICKTLLDDPSWAEGD